VLNIFSLPKIFFCGENQKMLHLKIPMKFYTNSKFRFAFVIALLAVTATISCKTASLDSKEAVSMVVSDSLGVDSGMIKMIQPYRTQLDSTMKLVIGYSENTLEKGTPESLLGNFLSDILVEVVKSEYADSINGLPVMSLLNNGGLRTSLPKGEITIENIFQLMPFDNEVVLLELTGDVLGKLFNIIAAKGGMPVGGLRLVLNASEWVSAEIGGVNFSKDAHFILVTSDYLATGGDGLSFLSENFKYIKTGLFIRDVFIRYIKDMTKQGIVIDPKLDGRIRYE